MRGHRTAITTATIKAVVEDEAEESGFYDAQSGAELTRDYGAAFTAIWIADKSISDLSADRIAIVGIDTLYNVETR